MGLKRLGKTLALEGGRLAVLVVAFWLLSDYVEGLRGDGQGQRTVLAEARDAGPVLKKDLAPLYAWIEKAAADIENTNTRLEESLMRLDGQRDEVASLVDQRTRTLEGIVLARLDSERGRVDETHLAVEAQVERIEQLSSMLSRDPVSMKNRMMRPTIQLRGNGTVGSGVIVYSRPQPAAADGEEEVYTTLALTAYHVVLEVLGDAQGDLLEEVQVFESATDEGERFQAKLIASDEDRDIALLRLNSPRQFQHTVDLISRKDLLSVDVFTPAYAVGCPLGNRPLPTLGEVSSKNKIVGDQSFWMINAPTFFGNSGGGVYLAGTHQLIGISSMIYTYGKSHPTVVPHMGLFVPLDAVYTWLDDQGCGFVYRREPVPAARSSLVYRGISGERSPAAPVAAPED